MWFHRELNTRRRAGDEVIKVSGFLWQKPPRAPFLFRQCCILLLISQHRTESAYRASCQETPPNTVLPPYFRLKSSDMLFVIKCLTFKKLKTGFSYCLVCFLCSFFFFLHQAVILFITLGNTWMFNSHKIMLNKNKSTRIGIQHLKTQEKSRSKIINIKLIKKK